MTMAQEIIWKAEYEDLPKILELHTDTKRK